MSRPCEPWPCPGREVHHERPDHGRSRGGVSGIPAGTGLSTPERGTSCSSRSPGTPTTRATADRCRPSSPSAGPACRSRRLGGIRPGGWNWCGGWPATSPPASPAPRSRPEACSARPCSWRKSFIYSEADIAALLEAARSLAPADGLRPRTYATLLGLMACTGLRITEALTLGSGDIDLECRRPDRPPDQVPQVSADPHASEHH